jgi:hypothetical protein
MFHLHLTAVTGSYEKEIIHRLIQRGYSVAPASDLCVTLQSPEHAGALISLQIDKLGTIHASDILDDVMAIMAEMQGKYYSMVVTAFSYDSKWTGSNFKLLQAPDKHVLN